jgi:sn-glycerol 3-phosphate transport system substrate-binding protein
MATPLRHRVTLVLVVALGAAGCTSSDDGGTSAGAAATGTADTAASSAPGAPTQGRCTATAAPPDGEPVVVSVWSGMRGRPGETLEEIVVDFNARSTGVQINLRLLDNTAAVAEEVLAAEPSERPVLALMDSVVLGAVAAADVGTPIQACLDEAATGAPDPTEDMVPLALATYRWHDQQLALPFGASTLVLFFDRERFREAGLDPDDPPQTLDELRAAAETLISSGTVPRGLVVDDATVGNWTIRQWAAQTGQDLLAPANGSETFPTDALIDTPATHEWMEWLQGMLRDGLATDIGPNPSGADGLLAALDPETPAAMTVTTCAAIGEVIRVGEAGVYDLERLGVAELPGPGSGGMVGGSGLWITTKDPTLAAAGWEVIQALVGAEAQARLAGATGYLPVTHAALDEPELIEAWREHPQLRIGYDQAIDTPVSTATIGMISQIERELVAVIDDAAIRVVDGADVNEALATAQELAQGLLDAAAVVSSGQSGP